jgi:hypothetical protein
MRESKFTTPRNRDGLQLVLLVQRKTLLFLQEHARNELKDAVLLNEREALVMLGADTVQKLLSLAQPGDTRIDDVLRRVAL